MADQSGFDDTVTFSESTIGPVTTEWDRDSAETPVFAVVSAVSEITNVDALELPPLHDAIDAEALNDLFTSRPEPGDVRVTFQYAGCDVVVDGAGTVTVESTSES